MEEQKISVVNVQVPVDCEEFIKDCLFEAKLNFKDSLKRQKCAMVWQQAAQNEAAPKEQDKTNIEDAL